jgi:hypothetical protein
VEVVALVPIFIHLVCDGYLFKTRLWSTSDAGTMHNRGYKPQSEGREQERSIRQQYQSPTGTKTYQNK